MSRSTTRPPLLRRLAAAATVTATVMTGLLLTAAPASAASARNGVCESGEFCYAYNSGFKGSVSDFSGSVKDLGSKQPSCYEFKSKGNGKGLCVKNHAAAVWNRTSKPVTVYYNSGYHGSTQTIAAGAKVNLSSKLKNQNAAHRFGTSSSSGSSTWSQSFLVRREDRSGFRSSAVTAYQADNIKLIIAVGKSYHISAKGIQTAIATTIVESWAYNRYRVTDADSGGLFQQRPASGWGSYSQVRNKLLAVKAFYGVASHTRNPGLTDFHYNAYSIGKAAQKVQRSAYPSRYQAQANTAIRLYNKYASSVKPFRG